MNITKLQQNIKEAEEALSRMKKELEYAERMNSKDYYPRFNIHVYSVEMILDVIDNNNTRGLFSAFNWSKTPQGNEYWVGRYSGKTPLSNEDKITLLRWCVNYYRNK